MAVVRLAAINIGAAALTAHPIYYLVDTTAELPSSGLKLGDTALAKDSNVLYKAASTTTWTAVDSSSAESFVAKSADQSVSTTTFENDNHLIFTALAAGTYVIEGLLFYSRLAGTASLLKIGFLCTDGAAEFQWSSGAPANGNATDLAMGSSTTGNAGTGTKSSMEFHGKLILTTAADFRLRWALQTATDTITMYKGSTMRRTKVA